MKTKKFIITYKDVEKLEKKSGLCLTDNGQPLDLMCRAYDLRTENDCEENNMEYKWENEKYSVENLDYTKAFINTLTPENRIGFSKDIEHYDLELLKFTEEEKELFNENQEFDNKDLQAEHDKDMERYYKNQHAEYLYGDRSEYGILGLLQEKMDDTVELNYDDDTGNMTIDQEQKKGEFFYFTGKDDFLATMKYKAESEIKAKQRKREENKIERENKKKRAEEHAVREKAKKIEKLLDIKTNN